MSSLPRQSLRVDQWGVVFGSRDGPVGELRYVKAEHCAEERVGKLGLGCIMHWRCIERVIPSDLRFGQIW
jgi:hypothetical protein